MDDLPTCAICMQTFAETPDEQARTLECGHRYHAGCFLRWIGVRPTCPLCTRPCHCDMFVRVYQDDTIPGSQFRVHLFDDLPAPVPDEAGEVGEAGEADEADEADEVDEVPPSRGEVVAHLASRAGEFCALLAAGVLLSVGTATIAAVCAAAVR